MGRHPLQGDGAGFIKTLRVTKSEDLWRTLYKVCPLWWKRALWICTLWICTL